MNSWQRACYGYKNFLTLTFAFIYQLMIQKAFKFIVKGTFGRNSSPKVFLDGQMPQILYRVALHFCQFSKHCCVKHINGWGLKLAL